MSGAPLKPDVAGYYDEPSGSISYIVADPSSGHAAIIDPVLDFDEKSARVSTRAADAMLANIAKRGLAIDWILDTHPHADHLTASAYLKEKLGAPAGIGAKVVEVQRIWRDMYNLPDLRCDGSQWDRLFVDGDTFAIGSLPARVMYSPGHTLASISYVIGDSAFIHDTLLQPDTGTARADFPGGSPEALYRTIMTILALPADTRLFVGHDYCANGRKPLWESTVAEQLASNLHFKNRPSLEDYVALRSARDRTLPMPRQILHALQINLNAGRLPAPESNGHAYLKIPLNAL